MNFTDHINRIERLTAQIRLHVQAENYQRAREDLDNIHAHTTAAQQQISELEFTKAQGKTDTEAYSP